MTEKKTRGRQKIEMKRIENNDERLITFSKRRSGIYKKASELAILTGSVVAFVVFSPAGNPFSFGDPSVDSVVNRFLGQDSAQNDAIHPLVEAHRKHRTNELTQLHNEMLRELEAAKEKEEEMRQKLKGKELNGWWNRPVEELSVEELHEMEKSFRDLRVKLQNKINEKIVANGASSSNATQMFGPFASNVDVTNPPCFPPRPPGHGHPYEQANS